MTSGSFGKVYEGFDKLNGNKPIICKINDEKEMNRMEGDILKALNKKGFKNFPQILAVGVQAQKPYQIMERFGQTLEFYQMINKQKFSYKTVHEIGI